MHLAPPLFIRVLPTPLGKLRLAATDDGLAGVWFEQQRHAPDTSWGTPVSSHTWLDRAAGELNAYFAGQGIAFQTPRVALWGTEFQRRVWQALTRIGHGQTTTYGALAAQLGQPRAVRAVAAAVGRNPWSIVVPCHRVVGASGALTGYAAGLERKAQLLNLEQGLQPPVSGDSGSPHQPIAAVMESAPPRIHTSPR
jgi:methylated-DNA-[protein]-cysteine S-methyltransferase